MLRSIAIVSPDCGSVAIGGTANVLSSDTVWQEKSSSPRTFSSGRYYLTIMPGRLSGRLSDSTKMEPEYMSPLTE